MVRDKGERVLVWFSFKEDAELRKRVQVIPKR